jgi:hypothetical protein
MAKDGVNQIFRVTMLPQNFRAFIGMLFSGMVLIVGPSFVVKVMQQTGEPPQFLVGGILPGVRTQAGFDGKGMLSEAFALRVLAQKLPGSVSIRHWWTSAHFETGIPQMDCIACSVQFKSRRERTVNSYHKTNIRAWALVPGVLGQRRRRKLRGETVSF